MRFGHRAGPAIIAEALLGPLAVGGGTYGETIEQTQVRQQVFCCTLWTTFT